MIKIATLCGMGFGTSMMLKLSIDDILKAEGVKAKVVPWDLSSYKGQKTDIIVAPVDMERHLKDATAEVIYIKNLIDKKEIADKVVPVVRRMLEED